MFTAVVLWLPLAIKLAFTAVIVVTAASVTERAGPFIGSLVVTLPVTIWPAYLFLALDQSAEFVAASAITSMVMHAATAGLLLVYVLAAQRWSMMLSLSAAVAIWVVLGLVLTAQGWSFAGAALLNFVAYPACMWIAHPYREAAVPTLQRQWYDIPARVLCVCALMGAVLMVSTYAGPLVTGFVAVFPIATVSTVLILTPRIGRKATAAMAANGMRGMAAIGVGLAAFRLAIGPLGIETALALLLLIPGTANLLALVQRTLSAGFRPHR